MTVTKDTDNNKEFGEKDEVTTFEFNADTDSTSREIFPIALKNKLKILYDRDWKRLK